MKRNEDTMTMGTLPSKDQESNSKNNDHIDSNYSTPNPKQIIVDIDNMTSSYDDDPSPISNCERISSMVQW
jgi:hypothetical protein